MKKYDILLFFISEISHDIASALPGSTATICCIFPTNVTEFLIAWSFNGAPVTVYTGGSMVLNDKTRQIPSADQFGTVACLEIPNVKFEDAGSYKCVRYSTKGIVPTMSRSVILNVQGEFYTPHIEINVYYFTI